tara:strand:+ start:2004 stop:2909 length:906 start_codon:yes stop_codon:yes gene_type:complete
MSKGIIIFAQNNEYVDYAQQACACAGYARKNLSLVDEICLVTNTETLESKKDLINEYFDNIIVTDAFQPENVRLFKDTIDNTEYASFKNMSRSEVYALSPYDETLVIDSDYFIMNNVLDQVWGSDNDVMINCKYRDVSERHKEHIEYLDNFSIPMYWATVFYFKKSDFAENLFTLVSHIKHNYKYYYYLYNCSGNLYRNDFAFSMALHILNGSVAFDVPSLPIEYLNNSFDLDDIFRINSHNDIIMYCADAERVTAHLLSRFTNTDLHVMNKKAIGRFIDDFLSNGEKVNESRSHLEKVNE